MISHYISLSISTEHQKRESQEQIFYMHIHLNYFLNYYNYRFQSKYFMISFLQKISLNKSPNTIKKNNN